jgi:hypothetical protein
MLSLQPVGSRRRGIKRGLKKRVYGIWITFGGIGTNDKTKTRQEELS